MTAIVFYRDGRIEVLEDARSVTDSAYHDGLDIAVRGESRTSDIERENLDVVKIELIP